MSTTLLPPTAVFVGFTTLTCGSCGVHFAMDSSLYDRRTQDHESFWCPNGHQRHFVNETEAQRLARQLDAQKADTKFWRDSHAHATEREDKANRRLRATRGVVTRYKRRMIQGRCPCCSHQFKDLARHMSNQHPKFDADKHIAAMEAKEGVS
jgi:hypothetical protein